MLLFQGAAREIKWWQFSGDGALWEIKHILTFLLQLHIIFVIFMGWCWCFSGLPQSWVEGMVIFQVKTQQSSLILLTFSYFSWINTHGIVENFSQLKEFWKFWFWLFFHLLFYGGVDFHNSFLCHSRHISLAI